MTDIEQVVNDQRPIEYAERIFPDVDGNTFCWTTREGRWKNCDRIEAYWENGEMAPIPWLAVYRDGEIIARVGARGHEIGYAPIPTGGKEDE